MPKNIDFALRPTSPLSPRELAILRRLTTGATSKDIASNLGITQAAVQIHLKTLIRKIGARDRTEAELWALHHGISVLNHLP
jgi:two-component system, NarL family, nitrate/nitrite response regulator NarL